jgi:hypothetical protein
VYDVCRRYILMHHPDAIGKPERIDGSHLRQI